MQDPNADFLRAAAQLTDRLSMAAESINVRTAQAAGQLHKSAEALAQQARQMQDVTDDFVQQVISAIAVQAPPALAQGMGDAIGQYRQTIEDCEKKARWACDALGEQRKSLSHAQSARVWISVAVLVVGTAAWASCMGYLAWSKKQEIAQLGYQEQVARVLQTQAVVSCGDGLCAKVNKNAAHYGTHGEYVQIVEP
jgi:hypothetical protein